MLPGGLVVLARDSLAVRPSPPGQVASVRQPAHAGRLRGEPARTTEQADSRLEQRHQHAERQREQDQAREDHIFDVIGSASPSCNGHRAKVPDTEMDIPYERKQWARLLIHEVPRPVLTPILEAIGDEDESMVDRYAALLANAAAGAEDEIPPSFPNILPDGRWIRSSPA